MQGRRLFVWRRKREPPEGDDVYGETHVDVLGITMKRHEIFQSGISPKVDKNPFNVKSDSTSPLDGTPLRHIWANCFSGIWCLLVLAPELFQERLGLLELVSGHIF